MTHLLSHPKVLALNVAFLLATVAAIGVVMVHGLVSADTPRQVGPTIPYQGVLSDAGGTLVTGLVPVSFAIYSQAEGGDPIWSEQQNVGVANGLFTALLGANEALPGAVFDGQSMFIGLAVNGDSEMDPRQPIFPGGATNNVDFAQILDAALTDALAALRTDLRTDVQTDVQEMFDEAFPEVEVIVSTCGTLDAVLGLGTNRAINAAFEASGFVGADAYGNGGEAGIYGSLGGDLIGLDVGAGGGLDVAACIETSEGLPTPEKAKLAMLGNRASATDLADLVSAASEQLGLTDDKLAALLNLLTSFSLDTDPTKLIGSVQEFANVVSLPGNLGDMVANASSLVPTDLDSVEPKCNEDYGAMTAVVNSMCAQAAAQPDFGQIIQDTFGVADDARGTILTAKSQLDNVQHVLGTDRPVDGTGNLNGAQPVSYWAYNSWARMVGPLANEVQKILDAADAARDHGASIRQTVNDNRGEILTAKSQLDNVQHVLGTERPIDGTGNLNGAQPISYWAYNSWARHVGPLANELNSIKSGVDAINTSALSSLKPQLDNIQNVLGTERPIDNKYGNSAQPVAFWAFHGWNNVVEARQGELEAIRKSVLNDLQPKVGTIMGRVGNVEDALGGRLPNGNTFSTFVWNLDGKLDLPNGMKFGDFIWNLDGKVDNLRKDMDDFCEMVDDLGPINCPIN